MGKKKKIQLVSVFRKLPHQQRHMQTKSEIIKNDKNILTKENLKTAGVVISRM
jgi:hypothetical protein